MNLSKQATDKKDRVIWWRAWKSLSPTIVGTKSALHYQAGGSVICGSRAQMYDTGNMPVERMKKCGRCMARLFTLIDAEVAKQTREYWLNPSRTEEAPDIPDWYRSKRERLQVENTQLGLPAELLPVGSGRKVADIGY